MTDLEKFIDMYKGFGVELKSECMGVETRINLDSYTNDKFEGYTGSISTVDFDSDGKFIRQGFWDN